MPVASHGPLLHIRILVAASRNEGLLDGARNRPADEVELSAGLVVRTRLARAAERLQADHGARRLVVLETEVSRSVDIVDVGDDGVRGTGRLQGC